MTTLGSSEARLASGAASGAWLASDVASGAWLASDVASGARFASGVASGARRRPPEAGPSGGLGPPACRWVMKVMNSETTPPCAMSKTTCRTNSSTVGARRLSPLIRSTKAETAVVSGAVPTLEKNSTIIRSPREKKKSRGMGPPS